MQYTIDATNKKLGRLASEIALILQGKKSANYDPRLAGDDEVIVSNAEKLIFSGSKFEKKRYYRHTGYMGHLKSFTPKEVFKKNPAMLLKIAVERMLPKNFLRAKRMKRLFITN
jgi:large subunit ribosomal protein L13